MTRSDSPAPEATSDPRPSTGPIQIAVCAGVMAFLLAYLAVDYFAAPRPFYDPLAARFFIARWAAGALPTGYVGAWSESLVAGVAIFFVVLALARRRRRPLRRDTLLLGSLWTLGLCAIVAGYFIFQSWPSG